MQITLNIMQKTSTKPTFLSKLKPHPSEIFALSLAAFFILAAKFQDHVLAENSLTGPQQPSHRGQSILNQPPGKKQRPVPVADSIFEVSEVYPDTSSGNFSDDFSDVATPPAPAPMASAGIHRSAELQKFLRKYRHEQQLKNQRQRLEGEVWQSLSKNATVTFGYVEEIFQTAAPQFFPDRPLAPREVLNDNRLSAKVFQALEMRFGVSAAELARFAKDKEADDLAEWAFFIENRL